jgi:hypothetical protein
MGDHYHPDMPSPKSYQQHRDPLPYYLPESAYDNRRLPVTNTKISLPTDTSTAGRLCTSEGLLLLSLPQDKIALSETLCVVREVRSGLGLLAFLCRFLFRLLSTMELLVYLITEH